MITHETLIQHCSLASNLTENTTSHSSIAILTWITSSQMISKPLTSLARHDNTLGSFQPTNQRAPHYARISSWSPLKGFEVGGGGISGRRAKALLCKAKQLFAASKSCKVRISAEREPKRLAIELLAFNLGERDRVCQLVSLVGEKITQPNGWVSVSVQMAQNCWVLLDL